MGNIILFIICFGVSMFIVPSGIVGMFALIELLLSD